MGNRFRGEVRIDIGDCERILRYDMNALCELENRLGKTISEIFSENAMGLTTIREALFVGLKWRDRKLTVTDVGDWLEFDQIGYYGDKLAECLALATGQDIEAKREGEEASPPLAVAAGE